MKKIVSLIICVGAILLGNINPIYAEEIIETDTGEYFEWIEDVNPRGMQRIKGKVVKRFKYKVNNKVQSPKFKLGASNVKVVLNKVNYVNKSGNGIDYDRKTNVSLNIKNTSVIFSSNIREFMCPSSNITISYGSGFHINHNYILAINVINSLPTNVYILADGYVQVW